MMAPNGDKKKKSKVKKLTEAKAKQTAEYKSGYGGTSGQKAGQTKKFVEERKAMDAALIKAKRAEKEAQDSTFKNGDYKKIKGKTGSY